MNKHADNTNIHVPNFTESVHELDHEFNDIEIIKVAKSLKNNKCCGDDGVLNEYIKSTIDIFLPLYKLLFNHILLTGDIPESWVVGNIITIYKNKGDKSLTENYRGISLLSCFGKFFTSLINVRLNSYIDPHNILLENQAGFRKGYSTTEHVFTLKCLIDLYLSKRKKLYCAFVDFRKAFDTVWRCGLWTKIISFGISGKLFDVIKNIYNNIKSCVSVNGLSSGYFGCYTGVRQGENLSPLLFSLYINDMERFF